MPPECRRSIPADQRHVEPEHDYGITSFIITKTAPPLDRSVRDTFRGTRARRRRTVVLNAATHLHLRHPRHRHAGLGQRSLRRHRRHPLRRLRHQPCACMAPRHRPTISTAWRPAMCWFHQHRARARLTPIVGGQPTIFPGQPLVLPRAGGGTIALAIGAEIGNPISPPRRAGRHRGSAVRMVSVATIPGATTTSSRWATAPMPPGGRA